MCLEISLQIKFFNNLFFHKLINDQDYGIYKCIAQNELGNKSVNFKVEGKKNALF